MDPTTQADGAASVAAGVPQVLTTPWVLTAIDTAIYVLAGLLCVVLIILAMVRFRRGIKPLMPDRPGTLAEDAIVQALLVYFVALFVMGTVIELTNLSPDSSQTLAVVGTIGHLTGIGACLWVARRRVEGGMARFVFGHAGSSWKRSLVAFACMSIIAMAVCPLFLWATVEVATMFRPTFEPEMHATIEALQEVCQPAWVTAMLWLGATLLAPLAEEFFFRGLLQTAVLRMTDRRGLAIAAASVAFGLVHMTQPQAVPALVLFGVLLGYVYERTGSLVPAVGIHALFNLKTLLWVHITATMG